MSRLRIAALLALILLLPACGAQRADPVPAPDSWSPSFVEFRLHEQHGVAGRDTHVDACTGEAVVLRDEVVIDLRHLVRAEVVRNRGFGYSVMVVLTPEGRERVALHTGNEEGERLSILVGGEVVNSPWVLSKLTAAHRLQLQSGLERAEAAALAARVNASLARGG